MCGYISTYFYMDMYVISESMHSVASTPVAYFIWRVLAGHVNRAGPLPGSLRGTVLKTFVGVVAHSFWGLTLRCHSVDKIAE